MSYLSASGDTIKTRIGALTGALLLGAVALPALGTGGAAAAVVNLYVNNAAGAHCSNAGQGTPAQPYCTISAAAAKVLPGETVHVAEGDYPEQVTVTRSGTAEAPITFTGMGGPGQYRNNPTTVGGGLGSSKAHAFLLSGAEHIRILEMTLSAKQEAVLVNGGSDITISRNQLAGGLAAGDVASWPTVRIAGAASSVRILRNNEITRDGFAKMDPGVQGTVIAGNLIFSTHLTGIVADAAPGTVIVANTISAGCQDAIGLAGASTGAVVENNVISHSDTGEQPCAGGGTVAGLRVDTAATSGTKVAYNAFDSKDDGPAYSWADTTYDNVSAFTAATGQGDHDLIGDVTLETWVGDSGGTPSPLIDSADENAPGMPTTDRVGTRAVDDPWVADTGTGSGHRDRGAMEQDNFGTRYTPIGPVRVLDTRDGTGTTGGTVPAGGTVELPVAGQHGVPADGVTAVTMNVTVTEPVAGGFLTVYPHGDDRPTASNLNWTPGQTIPNLVTVQVKDGKVSFYNGSAGTVHVLADLLGYFSTTGSGFTPTTPSRLLDTRSAVGAPKGPLGSGATVDLQVAGVKGIPASGLTSVTLNVTATEPKSGGFLTVYPHGTDRPTASSLNWSKGQTIPNLVTVPVKDGKVSFYNHSDGVQVLADVTGYFTASGGDKFHAVAPHRVIDTRAPWFADGVGEWIPAAPVGGHQTQGVRDVAYSNAEAVSLNVTVTQGTQIGFMTVYPRDSARPTVSNLNWTAGQTIANQVVVANNEAGMNSFYNASAGSVELIADLNGYYAP
ncbi:right-handed parallel beta-helix repeat-containing protein [Streptomyces sp. SID13666]|uniref:right-handed parallel beta-helix repeat-containing protein n=1 Tax=unclassified Streptomyces TaxID=2593676 RepID=UPI0013BFB253|nr:MULTISPECIES: right-handed parallel beta-helix repeat-containing protein [unclassified Streptomyces]NEA54463.1 right-handed parallel beta-helix repeat-containing protein [Streptomyces sp. SID13666]NEA72144.1 right-handed parallel beta-helix repeat-containing protein [Streptomyces sp. SID13588]